MEEYIITFTTGTDTDAAIEKVKAAGFNVVTIFPFNVIMGLIDPVYFDNLSTITEIESIEPPETATI
jgi:hypothetical protein